MTQQVEKIAELLHGLTYREMMEMSKAVEESLLAGMKTGLLGKHQGKLDVAEALHRFAANTIGIRDAVKANAPGGAPGAAFTTGGFGAQRGQNEGPAPAPGVVA